MTTRERTFQMKVLGRMLEHLGSQMYKRRDTALAELVANAWDAGATTVELVIPEEGYDAATSEIRIVDNGCGMGADDVQDHYLVVGRNRRAEGDSEPDGRKVMGRKGIGKLAGFGIASIVEVETKGEGTATTFEMDLDELKLDARDARDVPIRGAVRDLDGAEVEQTGTTITLKKLKHATPPDVEALVQSLGRRFSRVVHGEMKITVNGEDVGEPDIDYEFRIPEDGWDEAEVGGATIRYYYGFSTTVLSPKLLQGFTLYANGKTAQAPPFFFNVESTASGQHGTRYMHGAVEVDYLDAGTDDDSDFISTDRQEIDWEAVETQPLLEWGAELTRRALREWANRRESQTEESVLADEVLKVRIEALDKPSQNACLKTIRMLGRSSVDDDRRLELAGAVISAFEYQQFHDAIGAIGAIEDPEELAGLLGHLIEWKVLESRAILEIVKGRLEIIDKFHQMLVNDSPETAPAVGAENLHDLIASYPWLLDPEWQVLHEERTITAQLREWAADDIDEHIRDRYDFLALTSGGENIVIEIKRAGHDVELEDLQRLQRYRESLRRGHDQIRTAFVSGREWATDKHSWENRPELTLLEWSEVHERTRVYYEQYRAVLEADVLHRDFREMEREVAQTRRVVEHGTYRGDLRREGLGPQYNPQEDAHP